MVLPFDNRTRVPGAIAVSVVAVGAVTLSGALQQQPTPFHTSVELVELDVSATDREGRPISDLVANDLEVLEDGQPVGVASFRAVQLSGARAPATPALAPGPGIAWASNDGLRDGRLMVIVLDRVDRSRFYRVRQTVLAILKQLGHGDQVAMLSNGGAADYQVEFTDDPSRVVRALDSRGFLPGETGSDRLLRVLTRLAERLTPISGRRKIVVLVSEGAPEISRSQNLGEENVVPEFREFLTAALRANVAVYAFNPRHAFDVDGMVQAESVEDRAAQLQSEREGTSGLQTIAEATGGRATARTNAFEADVKRMFSESASYYLVAYYSRAPRDGKFHRISVRSRRLGVELRTRSGYLLPRSSPSVASAVPPVDRLVSAPIGSNNLPFRFVAVAAPSKTRRVSSVHILIEINSAQLSGSPGVDVKAIGVDMTGRVRATDRFTGQLQRPIRTGESRWVRLALSLDLPPGRYQLRVAVARSDDGVAGSVFNEIDVPDFRRKFMLGALIFGTEMSAGAIHADRILENLHVIPVATQDLPVNMTVRAGLPLRVSLGHHLENVLFVATLTSEEGTKRELLRVKRPATAFTDGGAFDFDVPLKELASGEYVLRLDVSIGEFSDHREIAFRVVQSAF
jgi:VWFA-related protein